MNALTFRSIGLYPFPLQDPVPGDCNSGKRPRFSDWQILAIEATDKQLELWSANGWNLGLSLGPSRLVALDSDTPAAEEWAAQLPPTPWVTATAKGRHRFYRLPENVDAPSNKVRVLACGLDRKAAGGYVVAPGSIHWTGTIYEAEGDWTVPLADLPLYNPKWFPEREILRPASMAAPILPCTDVIRRAKAYLKAIPPAVSDEGGNSHTYRVCCVLLRDFALTPDEAMACLIDWNLTCAPPWSSDELKEILKHAETYAKGSTGAKLQQDRPQAAQSSKLLWRGE